MAILSAGDLAIVYAAVVADLGHASGESIGVIKADLKAAITAADGWADANAAAYNAALPLPARTSLSTKAKARLLTAVIRRRFEISP